MRLMKTDSSVGSVTERSFTDDPAASAASMMRGSSPDESSTLRWMRPSTTARLVRTLDTGDERVGERRKVAGGRHDHDAARADRRLQLRRRVESEDVAVIHDRHPVAELVGFFHVVRRQQDGLAVVVEIAEDLPQRDAALRIEARGRLVEEQHLRPMHDRPCHHQPLRHAARQRHHRRLRSLDEPHPLQQLGRQCLGLLGAHAEVAAVELEVLEHRHRPVERVGLRDDADQLLGERRAGPRDRHRRS